MPDLASRLLDRLGMAVLLRRADGRFEVPAEGPAWFGSFRHALLEGPRASDGAPAGAEPSIVSHEALVGVFPFLDVFLIEAARAWEGGGTSRAPAAAERESAASSSGDGGGGEVVRSDPWTQQDPIGNEVVLEAAALRVHVPGTTLGAADVLVISLAGSAFSARQALQQRGNEMALSLEMRRRYENALKAAADAAREASEVKSRFVANMSHELRTPLNAIVLYSDLLKDEAEDRELDQVLSDVGRIKSAANHLLALINSVLDLAKIESGKMEVNAEEFDADALVREVADTALPLAMKNANRLVVSVDGKAGASGGPAPQESAHAPTGDAALGPVRTDPLKLRQVLLNLLSNACKFTSKGTVTFSAARRDDSLVFEVADTGIGLSAEQLARLFRPFEQADSTTQRRFGGTGLGLVLSKTMVELLGGSIEVESTLNAGTRFRVRIPARLGAPPGG